MGNFVVTYLLQATKIIFLFISTWYTLKREDSRRRTLIHQYIEINVFLFPTDCLRLSFFSHFFPFFFLLPLIFSFSTVLRFASVRETYAWQVRFRPSRGKRPPDCWEDIFRRCPRTPSFSGFSILEKKDSYGRRRTRSVGRVSRPSELETTWEGERR